MSIKFEEQADEVSECTDCMHKIADRQMALGQSIKELKKAYLKKDNKLVGTLIEVLAHGGSYMIPVNVLKPTQGPILVRYNYTPFMNGKTMYAVWQEIDEDDFWDGVESWLPLEGL